MIMVKNSFTYWYFGCVVDRDGRYIVVHVSVVMLLSWNDLLGSQQNKVHTITMGLTELWSLNIRL